jgi:hypothetical protein
MHTVQVDAGDPCGNFTNNGPKASFAVPLPKDPSTTHTAPPAGEIASFCDRYGFLWSGTDALQVGIGAGALECRRAAIIRGQAIGCDGAPLPGVEVSSVEQPEVGHTFTRSDGQFDLAVNGGGIVTLRYALAGRPAVDRKVRTSWNEFAHAPDVSLVPYDTATTAVEFATIKGFAVAQSTPVTDKDGTRRVTLLFPEGEKASLQLADGSKLDLLKAHIRSTEYTVGSCGPRSMPASLPPESAYTYAAELSADEAIEAGATAVLFEKPVVGYVENFLKFPTGTRVPVGIYEREAACWTPQPSGAVVAVLSVGGGSAAIDADGDGVADDDAKLASIGITAAERAQVAGIFKAGQSLWRFSVVHFSPCDLNMLSAQQLLPLGDGPSLLSSTEDDDCEKGGSIIGCHNQSLGEEIPVPGTGESLAYTSLRAASRGWNGGRDISLPLIGAAVPAGVLSVHVVVDIAGQHFDNTYPATPSLSKVFSWDGKDAYGSDVVGAQQALVSVGYTLAGTYSYPAVFGLYAEDKPFVLIPSRSTYEVSTPYKATLVAHAPGGDAAWTISGHRRYDPVERAVYDGDGRRRKLAADPGSSLVVDTIAGSGPTGIGAGTFSGDGGPAVAAGLSNPT